MSSRPPKETDGPSGARERVRATEGAAVREGGTAQAGRYRARCGNVEVAGESPWLDDDLGTTVCDSPAQYPRPWCGRLCGSSYGEGAGAGRGEAGRIASYPMPGAGRCCCCGA